MLLSVHLTHKEDTTMVQGNDTNTQCTRFTSSSSFSLSVSYTKTLSFSLPLPCSFYFYECPCVPFAFSLLWIEGLYMCGNLGLSEEGHSICWSCTTFIMFCGICIVNFDVCWLKWGWGGGWVCVCVGGGELNGFCGRTSMFPSFHTLLRTSPFSTRSRGAVLWHSLPTKNNGTLNGSHRCPSEHRLILVVTALSVALVCCCCFFLPTLNLLGSRSPLAPVRRQPGVKQA